MSFISKFNRVELFYFLNLDKQHDTFNLFLFQIITFNLFVIHIFILIENNPTSISSKVIFGLHILLRFSTSTLCFSYWSWW